MNTITTIIITVLVFGLLIFVHELGHFLTAKAVGIRVNEFALGMGPTVFSFTRGETKYALRLFPIGGFVSMEGEDAESDDERSFQKKAVWKRMIVVIAGAFMNLLIGFIILIILVSTSSGLGNTTIGRVVQGVDTSIVSPLKVGDKIVSIEGYRTYIGRDVTFGISRADPTGKSSLMDLRVTVKVRRDGKLMEFDDVVPFIVVEKNGVQNTGYSFLVNVDQKNVFSVLKHSFFQTISYVRVTWLGLIDLITGRVGIDGLSGVVGVGKAIGEAAKVGMDQLLSLVALIAVNLGVMNMLPIPALDGGRFVFLLIEVIRRKPIKQKYEIWVNVGGFAILILLMILVTLKDIVQIF